MSRPESYPGLWRQGWYRFARHLPSPNFGPRPEGVSVDLLVLHSISLPPGVYGGDQVQRLFTNQLDFGAHPWFEQLRGLEVSAHFYIRRTGDLWQFVSCDDRAWHAGKSLHLGRENCNDYSVGIELEGLEGDCFEPANTRHWPGCVRRSPRTTPSHTSPGMSMLRRRASTTPGPGLIGPSCAAAWVGHRQCFPSIADGLSKP
jgi:AmpD protein